MARFELELPEEIMKDFQRIYDNADDIFGAMTKAGAEVVMSNIKALWAVSLARLKASLAFIRLQHYFVMK